MLTIVTSTPFDRWLAGLKDHEGRARILDRLDRLAAGHFGDTKSLGDSISELRMHAGPGYRIYYMRHGDTVIVLLMGGDKRSQVRDIRRAKVIAESWNG